MYNSVTILSRLFTTSQNCLFSFFNFCWSLIYNHNHHQMLQQTDTSRNIGLLSDFCCWNWGLGSFYICRVFISDQLSLWFLKKFYFGHNFNSDSYNDCHYSDSFLLQILKDWPSVYKMVEESFLHWQNLFSNEFNF
mgnify:CR=1 FL=1